ncbi:MAG: hypothetical protein ACE5FW_03155 [Candidatus Aenigmatarchaeota archaeon]
MKVKVYITEIPVDEGGVEPVKTSYEVPVKPAEKPPWEERVYDEIELSELGLLRRFQFPSEWYGNPIRPVKAMGDDLVIERDSGYNLGKVVDVLTLEVSE